jgi:hypothetical protein
LSAGERPRYVRALLPGVQALHARRGRPHWLVVDDAHHFFPRDAGSDEVAVSTLPSLAWVTPHPAAVSPRWLDAVTAAAVLGEAPAAALRGAGIAIDGAEARAALGPDETLVWRSRPRAALVRVATADRSAETSTR